MANTDPLDPKLLNDFASSYHSAREADAVKSRGDFLRLFPRERLKNLTLDQYVIGRGTPTFCAYVEAKTRAWAVIQGASASKFGVYFGRTNSDPERKYRFTKKFGDTEVEAFKAVKRALLDLVHEGAGDTIDFQAIDSNPLSQMFKAKILSLYFPKRFLNVCSADHIELLASALGIPDRASTSERQYLLAQAKQSNPVTRTWSNPRFMEYLFTNYVWEQESSPEIMPPGPKKHRRVNFEDVQAARDAIGKAAEEFALSWEHERLRGDGLEHLIPEIVDRRDRPGYGYDFMSFSSPNRSRFIEVKSVGKADGCRRFFLSDNEHAVSKSDAHRDEYYFYLVLFDGNGTPMDVKAIHSGALYETAELVPAAYVVRFDLA